MIKYLLSKHCIKFFHKKQKVEDLTDQMKDLNDRVDCLQRSVTNLRKDLPIVIQELLLTTLKQTEARRIWKWMNSQ